MPIDALADNFFLAAGNPLEKVIDHVQLGSGGFASVTNHMILMCVASLILLAMMSVVAVTYKFRLVPRGFQNAIEAVLLYIRDEVVHPALGKSGDAFLPFLWTLFFFILINNLLGLLPLYDLTYKLAKSVGLPHPIYGTATGNLMVTGALAVIVFVLIQAYGISQLGINGYLKHLTAGTPKAIWPIIVPVEILGMFVKPFALMMRLFANMLAGGIVLKVFASFVGMAAALGVAGQVAVGVPVVLGSVGMTFLKLFVAFLQAFLFVLLTCIFLSQMQHHHDDHHDEAHHEGHGNERHGGEGHSGERHGGDPAHQPAASH